MTTFLTEVTTAEMQFVLDLEGETGSRLDHMAHALPKEAEQMENRSCLFTCILDGFRQVN